MFDGPGVYLHYKGKRYLVHGVALHTETGERLVVYQDHAPPGAGCPALHVRPFAVFNEQVGGIAGTVYDSQPRFVKVL